MTGIYRHCYGGVTYQLKLVRTGSKLSWVIKYQLGYCRIAKTKTYMRTLNILGVSFVLRLSASNAVYELSKVELMLLYNWCFLTDMMIVHSVNLYYMFTKKKNETTFYVPKYVNLFFLYILVFNFLYILVFNWKHDFGIHEKISID